MLTAPLHCRSEAPAVGARNLLFSGGGQQTSLRDLSKEIVSGSGSGNGE